MRGIILELKERWKAEMPDFWKKVRNISVSLGTAGVALVTANATFNLTDLGVPAIIFTIAGYIIAACYAIGLSAQITKQ